MTEPARLPRPATDLFPEALALSPKQREVLDVVDTFSDGATAAQIAERLGMHVNTARGHLDELQAAGAVAAVAARSRGRGRPSLIFRVRVPDNQAIASEYVSLVTVLLDQLADDAELTDYDSPRAREIGRQWARKLEQTGPVSAAQVQTRLQARLRAMGFDPEQTKRGLCLHACPFVSAGQSPTPFLCAVHEGYLQEMTAAPDGEPTVRLHPLTGSGTCLITQV